MKIYSIDAKLNMQQTRESTSSGCTMFAYQLKRKGAILSILQKLEKKIA